MPATLEEQIVEFQTEDGVPLRLTRLRGGDRGPLLVAPGIATSTGTFRLSTVETNLADVLVGAGYDTWLFDWRGSSALQPREFLLDDVGRYDWPAAVAQVRERTGAADVQVMAHCLASVSLMMALGGGYLDCALLRSVVLSAVAGHIQVPRQTELKAYLRLPRLLRRFGVRFADPRVAAFWDRSSPLTRALDRALRVQLRDCPDDVCHRVSFIYGILYEHDNLNAATHASLAELFGPVGLQTFLQLEQLVKAGHLRAYSFGRRENLRRYGAAEPPDYLENVERFDLPITFIHGAESLCFLPESTRQTHDLLRDANAGPYARHVVPGYGHMDLLIGQRSAQDVYPLIVQALDEYARA